MPRISQRQPAPVLPPIPPEQGPLPSPVHNDPRSQEALHRLELMMGPEARRGGNRRRLSDTLLEELAVLLPSVEQSSRRWGLDERALYLLISSLQQGEVMEQEVFRALSRGPSLVACLVFAL